MSTDPEIARHEIPVYEVYGKWIGVWLKNFSLRTFIMCFGTMPVGTSMYFTADLKDGCLEGTVDFR